MGPAEHTDLCPLSVPTQSLAHSTCVTVCEEPRDTGLLHTCGGAARHRTGMNLNRSHVCRLMLLPLLDPRRLWGLHPLKDASACLISCVACRGFCRRNPEESCGGGERCLWPEGRADRWPGDREKLWLRESLKSHLLGPEGSPGRAEKLTDDPGATEGDRVGWMQLACSKPGFAISPHG